MSSATKLWKLPWSLILESHPEAGAQACGTGVFHTDSLPGPSRQFAPLHTDSLPCSCTESTEINTEITANAGTRVNSSTPSPGSSKTKRSMKYHGISPRRSKLTLKTRNDIKYQPVMELLEKWDGWCELRRHHENKTPAKDDQWYPAMRQKWYNCFCGLIDAGETPGRIDGALNRAFYYNYPLDWPQAFKKRFQMIADHDKIARWGTKDWMESKSFQQAISRHTTGEEFKKQVIAMVRERAKDNDDYLF